VFRDYLLSKLICHIIRGTESFDTHVWILKSLLRQSEGHLETLQLYVVAADFKKMLARMKHPVSTHYLACLQRVKSLICLPLEEVPTQSQEDNNTLFLDDIPILAERAKTKIPNLEKAAKAAQNKEPFKLYSKDTCMEFHELLREILERFQQSLNDLRTLMRSKVRNSKEPRNSPDQSEPKDIMDKLRDVLAFGRTLRGIVQGSAITAHLAAIAPFLEVKAGKFWPMACESEDDAEFHLLKPYSTEGDREPLLPWKSFHDWLRLMVHHFDAIHILDNHLMKFNSLSIDLSIKILYPSLPDENMLPWKDLLENENYFPPIPHTPDQPSATKLITFLTSPTLDEDGKSIKLLIENIGAVIERQTAETMTGTVYTDFSVDIEKVTSVLEGLVDTSSGWWRDYVLGILEQVEGLAGDTTHSRSFQLEGISNMVQKLEGSFKLYKEVKPKTSLSLGKHFAGAIHCEVCAAPSNSFSGTTGPHDGLSKDLLEEYKVSHIFVSCSNLC
jgi:hypothetical protein